ncbi:hypothetical protein Tco_0321241 [Tanacetum coccineum]
MSDEPLAIPLDEIQIDDKLPFIEEPVEIIDREVKRLKQSRISIVKVRWNFRRGHEFTWEREDQMQKKYPHLFLISTPVAETTYVLPTGRVIATVSIKVPTGRHLVKLPDPLALLSNPSISAIHFPIIGGAIVSRLIKLWTPEDCQRVILFWMHLCFFCECFSTKTHTPCASSIDDVALSLREGKYPLGKTDLTLALHL